MANPIFSDWKGFLPRGAIVMARRKAEEPCSFCRVPHASFALEGDSNARLVFVGEKGSPEDRALLYRMIEAMGLDPDQVALTNLACCEASLHEKIASLHPEMIIALGENAASLLIGSAFSFERDRGKPQSSSWAPARILPTFHPSELLSTPALKRDAWEDLKTVASEVGIELPSARKSAPSEAKNP